MAINYEVKLTAWSGPIEALLDLIEEKKMSITDINLASVTSDFLVIIERVPPRNLADFLVVAAQLILIKSRILLPSLPLTVDEEDGIRDLETKLFRLRSIRQYSREITRLWNSGGREFSRPLFKGQPIVFYPSRNMTVEALASILRSISTAFHQETREMKTLPPALINLEEKIQEIIQRLSESADREGLRFDHLAARKTKQEIVVLFLAILHLLERRLIRIEQKKHFGDIAVVSQNLKESLTGKDS